MKLAFTVLALKMALTILLQLNRDDTRLFTTEGLGKRQLFSLICMHCNKKVGAISHRLHPPARNSAGAPGRTWGSKGTMADFVWRPSCGELSVAELGGKLELWTYGFR